MVNWSPIPARFMFAVTDWSGHVVTLASGVMHSRMSMLHTYTYEYEHTTYITLLLVHSYFTLQNPRCYFAHGHGIMRGRPNEISVRVGRYYYHHHLYYFILMRIIIIIFMIFMIEEQCFVIMCVLLIAKLNKLYAQCTEHLQVVRYLPQTKYIQTEHSLYRMY